MFVSPCYYFYTLLNLIIRQCQKPHAKISKGKLLLKTSWGQLLQGSIEGHEGEYTLDRGHTFIAGKPGLVCGNTAAMLGEDGLSWLAPHFKVQAKSLPSA